MIRQTEVGLRKKNCPVLNYEPHHGDVCGTGSTAPWITVEPGYNDIGLYDTSSIALDILSYQLIPHC
jgi:hypothetical protein